MAEIDSAQEWRRLQELYAGMGEDELEAVAGQAYELTDIAKQALHAEISRRNLKLMVRLAPTPKEPEIAAGPKDDLDAADLDLRLVISVENLEQAEWVKQKLNQSGVLCRFGPQVIEDAHRVRFSDRHPVGVRVLLEDEKRARHLLQDFSARFGKEDEEEEESDYSARCPKCHSTEIVFQGLGTETPVELDEIEDADDAEERTEQTAPEHTGLDAQYNWSCDACGHHWRDDGVET
jgi:hypothetical protein